MLCRLRRALCRLRRALAKNLTPASRTIFAGNRHALLTLTFQPAFVARAIPIHGDTLRLQPAVVVGQIRFGA